VYKLQFFTFIFAVLLPVLSRLLIMFINTFFRFFKMADVRHLGFVIRIENPRRALFLVVFITVHSLVGIDAVVLIIRTFFDFVSWLENAYSRPKIGGLSPKWGAM